MCELVTPAVTRHAVDAVITALSVDPSRPRLTTYDQDGNRTELSGTALLNWASKVAGLLVDELGGTHGDAVVVRSGLGWQTAGVLVGAWWGGLTVTDEDEPGALAAFVADGADAVADEVLVVSGHPLGAPSRQVQAHQRDFTGAVLGQADRFGTRAVVPGDEFAVTGSVTVAEFDALVRAGSGLSGSDRLVVTGSWDLPRGSDRTAGVISGLLAPLAAGASVILCSDWAAQSAVPDLTSGAAASRLASEGATHVLGADGIVRPL